jgi:hypothetical protein
VEDLQLRLLSGPSHILLCGLKTHCCGFYVALQTYCYAALRHTAMRPLRYTTKTYNYARPYNVLLRHTIKRAEAAGDRGHEAACHRPALEGQAASGYISHFHRDLYGI